MRQDGGRMMRVSIVRWVGSLTLAAQNEDLERLNAGRVTKIACPCLTRWQLGNPSMLLGAFAPAGDRLLYTFHHLRTGQLGD